MIFRELLFCCLVGKICGYMVMVYMSCEGYLTDLNIFKRIMIMELFFFFSFF